MPNDHRGRNVHGGKVTDDAFRSVVSQRADGNWQWEVANADYAPGEASSFYMSPKGLQPGSKRFSTSSPEFGVFEGDAVASKGVTSTERRADIAAGAMARRIALGGVNLDTGRTADLNKYGTASDFEVSELSNNYDDDDDYGDAGSAVGVDPRYGKRGQLEQ
jgi:hypothetical protein